MKFKLEINMGNDTVETAADVGNLLLKVVRQLTKEGILSVMGKSLGDFHAKIMDTNGNSVGTWKFVK